MSPYREGDGSGWTPDWYMRFNPGGGYTNPHRVSNRPTQPARARTRPVRRRAVREPWWAWALLTFYCALLLAPLLLIIALP